MHEYILGEFKILQYLVDEVHSSSTVAVWSAVVGPIVGAVASAVGSAAAALRWERWRGASVNMAAWMSGILGGCGGAIVASAAVHGYWMAAHPALFDPLQSVCLLMLTTTVAGSVVGCGIGILVTAVPWLRGRRGRLTKAGLLGAVLSAVAGAAIGWCGVWLYWQLTHPMLDDWLWKTRLT